MAERPEYHCYTDGSCKAADGAPGGWGFVIKRPGLPALEAYGKASGTIAKIMEYQAVAEALAALPAGVCATVFCDNLSLIENMTRKLANWQSSNFVNVDPLVVDSVRSIHDSIESKKLIVRWQWLRGHNGNTGNERADALAAQGAREAKAQLAANRNRRPR